MGAYTQPLIVGATGSAQLLDRIPLTSAATDFFSERWLQEALFANPESLPIKEIDPHMGPLIPVCMEIETGSGPADMLFVTPTGQIVLVETKLWRNPEARREVVGQILDYAKHLTTWTYDQLDRKASAAAATGSNFLLGCLKSRYPSADETSFVDGVQRSLSTGDFLLLIVGDGIRSGAESLVTFLEQYGHLRFGIGLIEVAAYRLPDGARLLQPRVLAKTEILQRTILVGPTGPISFQEVAQQEDATASPNSPQREWFAAFWRQFIEQLALDDATLTPTEPAKSPNQFFPMPPGGGMAWISAYIAQSIGEGGVYLTFGKAFQLGPKIYELLESDADSITKELGVRLSWKRTGDKVYVGAPNVIFKDLNDPVDRERVIRHLTEMTQRMIRVLKPRLESAIQDMT